MGKTIYFSGPDGSGKTTSFLRAVEILQQNGKTVFQLRTLQVGRLRMMLRKSAGSQKPSPPSHPGATGRPEAGGDRLGVVGRLGHSDLPRQRGHGLAFTLRRYVGLVAALADIATFGRGFLRRTTADYDVVLVEECPFDVFAKRHRPFFPLTARLFRKAIPRPDLLVLCVADAADIVRRKPELTELEVRQYYATMARVYEGAELPILHNDTNASETPFARLDEAILGLIA
ncbi:MAG: hypothetical protein KBF78_02550 [Fuscovulum sp.]|nr:hypothetical protein [Fuscovulum sp.]